MIYKALLKMSSPLEGGVEGMITGNNIEVGTFLREVPLIQARNTEMKKKKEWWSFFPYTKTYM